MNKHNFMETESITKLLIKFSLPAVIGMIVNALYNIVDRIYIGNIKGFGHYPIAGVGLSYPSIIIIFAFALLIGIGSSANISIKLGQKKLEDAEQFLGVSLCFSMIISLSLMLLYFLFIDNILIGLGGEGKTLYYAKEYLYYLIFGFPALTVSNSANACIRSDGSPKMSMFTLLIGAIINIILDPIFIFGFSMGVKGAAIATIISQYISAIWTLHYFTSNKSRMKLRLKNIQFDLAKMKKIVIFGSSVFAINIGVAFVNYTVNNRLLTYGGDLSIAAMSIIQSILSFMIMPLFGINQGVQPIIGYNYGANKYDRVKETLIKGILAATVICIFGFSISMIFGEKIIKIFTSDKELLKLATRGLRIKVLVFPIVGSQIVSSSYFQAVGKAKLSFLISLSRQIIVLVPCLYILSFIFGLQGIFFATPVADFISTTLTFFLVRREFNILNKKQQCIIEGNQECNY